MWRAILGTFVAWVALHASNAFAVDGTYVPADGALFSACINFNNADQRCSIGDLIPYYNPGSGTANIMLVVNEVGQGCQSNVSHAAAISAFHTLGNDSTAHTVRMLIFGNTDAACAGVSMNIFMAFTCNNGQMKTNRTQCLAGSCALNRKASLLVPLTGANPSASEYASVCFEGCEFDIGQASIWVDSGQSPPKYYMRGLYNDTGQTCTGAEPPLTGDDLEDLKQDGSGDGKAADQAGVDEAGKGGYACDVTDDACRLNELSKDLAGQKFSTVPTDPAKPGPLGAGMAFPFLEFFNLGSSPRVCSLEVSLANLRQGVRQLVGDHFTIDMCPYQSHIDRIGGFVLYLLTALILYAMFFRTPGT